MSNMSIYLSTLPRPTRTRRNQQCSPRCPTSTEKKGHAMFPYRVACCSPLHSASGSNEVLKSTNMSLTETQRRSGNYHPSIWSHSRIISLTPSTYSDARFLVHLEELKRQAKLLLEPNYHVKPLVLLKTIDAMQRLGVAYHFDKEIERALDHYHEGCYPSADSCEEVVLGFRLLRQHGHQVSSDRLVRSFEDLNVLDASVVQDARCLLTLYEASYLANYGETDLAEVKGATATRLGFLVGEIEDSNLAKQVDHSLQTPLHWMMPRLEAIRHIKVYEAEEGRNQLLLELAKLDFNIVQSLHQRELRELSWWWKGLGLMESLPFSRDRLVECYLWAVGIAFEPQFFECRMELTKMNSLITVVDDMYDVYGSLDELEAFTATVESWKLETVNRLPDYMKSCFLALDNFVDEVVVKVSKVQSWDAKPLLQREWQRLCKGYLLEASWLHEGYKPTFTEYMDNAWVTVAGPLGLVHVHLLLGSPIPYSSADCLDPNHRLRLVALSSLIIRISDDLGTYKAETEKGDVVKAIQCYMEEACESEEKAEEHMKSIIEALWTELNGEHCHRRTQLRGEFVRMVLNFARTALCIYQRGDGFGTSTGSTRDMIVSLFFQDVQ